jgi:hypothetical protein
MKKYWYSITGSIILISLLSWGIWCKFQYLSETILAITAIIILWYTWETFQIRKSNQELLYKSRRPVVGFEIFVNKDKPVDTWFRLINHSDYPVAALVKCNFKLGGKEVPNVWDAYNGKEFWNLQYKQIKEGHFNWLDLYSKLSLFSGEEIKELKTSNYEHVKREITKGLILKYDFESPPNLTMDVEIFCLNDHDEKLYYPSVHYEFDPYRIGWVVNLTSKKPYWKFESEPIWVKNVLSNYTTNKKA